MSEGATIQVLEGMERQERQIKSSFVPYFEDQEKGSKWKRTFKCGCGECRFIPTAQRMTCLLENSSSAIWLWSLDSDKIGTLDYQDIDLPPMIEPEIIIEKEIIPRIDVHSEDNEQ